MLIIIEGVDGTGKTTLADRLAEALPASDGVWRFHRGKPLEHPLIEYTVGVAGYEPGGRHHVICDRWHLGEWVYGPLYRGGSDLTEVGFTAVEELLDARGAVLIYCHGIARLIEERLRSRDGEAPSAAVITRDMFAFERVLMRSRLPRLHLSMPTIDDVPEVIRFARHREAEVARVRS